jgi:septum formation protein
MSGQKIILASGSAQRKTIFSSLNLPFEVIPADIDEKAIRDEDLKLRAEKIARGKAEKVAADHEGIIIAADTFVECGGKVFEKPANITEAKEMLKQQSNNEITVFTGFCYIDKANNIDYSTGTFAVAYIRELSDAEISEYVGKFPVTTWSSAFSPAFLYGQTLIASMNGSLTGLIYGIPMELVITMLRKSGYEPKP